MKKLIASLCAVLACSFLFTATPVQAKTTNYEMTLTKSYQRIWSNGTNKIYITTSKDYTKQKLYLKNVKSGKKKVLKTFTLNQENDDDLPEQTPMRIGVVGDESRHAGRRSRRE